MQILVPVALRHFGGTVDRSAARRKAAGESGIATK